MDLTILKKKISSYRTPKGKITNLPDELLGEILYSWEHWTGASREFYAELGADHRKMASLIGRAKKLKREGAFDGIEFSEVLLTDDEVMENPCPTISSGCGIELVWKNNHIIRFSSADLLMDFLKKVA